MSDEKQVHQEKSLDTQKGLDVVAEDGLTEMQQGVHRQDGITWQKIRPGW